jgi:PKD repeat protein
VFTLEVKDSGNPRKSQKKIYNIQIKNKEIVRLLTTSLPTGTVQSFYSRQLNAQGGSPPYQFALLSGTLPPGITLHPDSGMIEGTPTQAGGFTFGIEVADTLGQKGTGPLLLLIESVTANPIQILTQSLPPATAQMSYSTTLNVSGGVPPYQFDLESGRLPTGLALDGSSGAISGVPAQSGSTSFTLRVRDSASGQATAPLSLTVQPALDPLAITTSSLPQAMEQAAYSAALSATGGTPPYQFAISAGSLPAGITLTAGNGLLAGTPTQFGIYPFDVTVSDSVSAQATVSLSITVQPAVVPLVLTTATLPPATQAVAYSAQLTVTGGSAPYSFSIVSGSLPAGVTLESASGNLTGSPSESGVFNFAAGVQDSLGTQASAALSLAVASNSGTSLQLSMAASRTTGVAPLSVFFDATGTSSSNYPSKPFHGLAYHWDFADSGASRANATGPVASHVFETPGSYLVRLTVTEPDGRLGTSEVSIDVTDPDQVYAGSNTICISSSGNFTGAPAGAQQVTTSSFDAGLSHYTGGRRVLFRRGESFNSSGMTFSNSQLPGGGIIGAFGQGSNPDSRGIYDNNPRILCSGWGAMRTPPNDVRIMDLSFEDPGGTADNILTPGTRMDRVLLLRIKTTGFRVPLICGNEIYHRFNLEPHDQFSIVDSHFDQPRENGMYIAGFRLSLLGTKVERAGISHLVRITHTVGCVIDSNQLEYPGGTRHVIKLHAQHDKARYGEFSERIVISRNLIRSTKTWMITLSPQDDHKDERVREALVEKNTIIAEGTAGVGVFVTGSDVTVRNNQFVDNGSTNWEFHCVRVTRRGSEPVAHGVEVYHNTYYNPNGRNGGDFMVSSQSHTGPVMVKNNLIHAPATANVNAAGGWAPYESVGNLVDEDPLFVDPNNGNFTLQNTSPAIGRGLQTLPVLDDYLGRMRSPSQSSPSVGAHEK